MISRSHTNGIQAGGGAGSGEELETLSFSEAATLILFTKPKGSGWVGLERW